MKFRSFTFKLLLIIVGVGVFFFLIPNYITSSYLVDKYETEIHLKNNKIVEGAANLLTSELLKVESTVETFKLITQDRFSNDGDYYLPDLNDEELYYEDLFMNYLSSDLRCSNSLYIYFEPTLDSVETHDIWMQIRDNQIIREKEYVWDGYNPVPSTQWFYEPKEKKFGYWVDPYRNRFEKYITSYVTPIYIKDNFVGIFGMYLELESIENLLSTISHYDGDMFWLLNSKDEVIFHPNHDDGVSYKDFIVSGSINNDGVIEMNVDNMSSTKSYYSYIIKLDQNWTFVYSIPVDSLNSIHQNTQNLLLMTIIVTLVCLSILVLFIVNYYKRMFDGIINGLKKIKDGKQETVVQKKTNDEIGLLIDAINESNHSLVQSIAKYKRTEKKLNTALQNAEIANEAKTRFLANMSHELRTPMNGMIGMIQLTLMDDQKPEHKEQLTIAKRSAEVLVNILNDILDFSSMEAGKISLNPSYNNLDTLMTDILALYKPLASSKAVTISGHIIGELPKQVYCDSKRLKQVLTNLLGNAVKFTNDGYVQLCIEVINKSDNTVKLLFSCTDTGVGISKEDIGLIFNRFTQVDSSNKRLKGGTGLGLTISKKLIELMNGELKCESMIDVGSKFFFELELNYQDELDNPHSTAALINESESIQPLKILIVDDDLINGKILKAYLTKKSHICYIASNGHDAINLNQLYSPDIILMDISMPVMDGVEAMNIIRKDYPSVIIIAQTAFAYEKDRINLLENGFDNYLSKPIDFEVLDQVISDTLHS